MSGYHHRAGSQHQANKIHKTGGHSTKRDIDRSTRGRVEKSSVAGSAATSKRTVKSTLGDFAVQRKVDRLNQSKQLTEQRRQQAQAERRLAGGYGPPKQVVIFGLSEHARAESIVALLVAHADAAGIGTSALLIGSPIAAVYNTLRQRVVITVCPRPGQYRGEGVVVGGPSSSASAPFQFDVSQALSVAQSADVLVMVADMSRGPAACIDAAGDLFLSCLKATGVPSVVGVVTGVEAGSAAMRAGSGRGGAGGGAPGTGGDGQGSSPAELRKYAHRLLETEVGTDKEECRIVEVTDPSHVPSPPPPRGETSPSTLHPEAPYSAGLAHAIHDGSVLALARAVAAVSPRHITWRSDRSYLTAMNAEWEQHDGAAQAEEGGASEGEPHGTLRLYGYLRGRPLHVSQLMSLSRGGSYPIASVTSPGVEAQPFKVLSKAGGPLAPLAPGGPVGSLFLPLAQAIAPYGIKLRHLSMTAPLASAGPPGSLPSSTLLASREDAGAAAEAPDAIAVDVDMDAGEQTWPEDNNQGGRRLVGRGLHMLDEEDEGMEEDEDMGEGGEAEGEGGEEGEADAAMAAAAAASYDAGALVGLVKGSAEYTAVADRLMGEALAKAKEERERLQARNRRARLVKAGKAVPDEVEEEEEEEEEEEGGCERLGGGGDDGMDVGGAGEEDVDDRAGGGSGERAGRGQDDTPAGRAAAAKDATDFPDEVDTPLHEPARARFARYRGLKSFRTSPWEKDEGLPLAYAHIFGLASYHRTSARIKSEGNLALRALLSLEGGKAAEAKAAKKGNTAAGKRKAADGRRAAAVSAKAAGGGDEEMSGAGEGGEDAAMDVTTGVETGEAGAGAKDMTLADLIGPGWVAPGQYVCIHLSHVPASAVADAACLPHSAVTGGAVSAPGIPLTAMSLLKHEARATVVHASITRWPPYTAPVKSRDNLEFHVWGSRVVDARPVFSGLEVGLDRARAERFLQPGKFTTASFYGPLCYGPAPVLVYRRVPVECVAGGAAGPVAGGAPSSGEAALARVGVPDDAGVHVSESSLRASLAPLYPGPDRLSADVAGRGTRLVLVGMGKIVNADPDTLLLKRTVLTGFPVKVEGRFAVARSMFFSIGDIDWFKPIAVHTKSGATGHITMSVGTHGRMKLRFDRPITQADVVCLPLYKRVFARWGRGYTAAYPQLAEGEGRDGGVFGPGSRQALAGRVMATKVVDHVQDEGEL